MCKHNIPGGSCAICLNPNKALRGTPMGFGGRLSAPPIRIKNKSGGVMVLPERGQESFNERRAFAPYAGATRNKLRAPTWGASDADGLQSFTVTVRGVKRDALTDEYPFVSERIERAESMDVLIERLRLTIEGRKFNLTIKRLL